MVCEQAEGEGPCQQREQADARNTEAAGVEVQAQEYGEVVALCAQPVRPAGGVSAKRRLVGVPALVFRILCVHEGSEEVPGQVCAVRYQYTSGEEQKEEVFVVPSPQAVVHPYAVMIHSRDAGLAYTTVLAARGLEEVAG